MIQLERLRRRIPYAYWLFYDALIWTLLLITIATYGPRPLAVALPFLAMATTFDAVELLAKWPTWPQDPKHG